MFCSKRRCIFGVGNVLMVMMLTLGADPKPIENVETATGVSEADPFATDSGHVNKLFEVDEGNATKRTATVFLRYESYEMSTLASIALMDEQKDEESQRSAILEMVKNGEAKIVESFATRLEAGTTSTLDNLVEKIYPTEYEPPTGVPDGSALDRPEKKLTATEKKLKMAMKFACPTSFDTKQIGYSLEAKVGVVVDKEKYWDVMLLIEKVEDLGVESWVEDTITMPQFGVARQNHFLRVKDAQWNLLSSQNKIAKNGKSDSSVTHHCFFKVEQVR